MVEAGVSMLGEHLPKLVLMQNLHDADTELK